MLQRNVSNRNTSFLDDEDATCPLSPSTRHHVIPTVADTICENTVHGVKDNASESGVEDLNPTPALQEYRTWRWPTFAIVWTSTLLNPSSISVGASLLALGLSWWEVTLAQLLGGLITLAALILMAWPGVKYGIPFPVLARSSFGVHGAHICTLSRGAVAVMWLSWQMWQGAAGLYFGIGRAAGPGFLEWSRIDDDLTTAQLLLLLAFAGTHCLLIWVGIRQFRLVVWFVMPLQLGLFIGILVWACQLAPVSESLDFQSGTRGSSAIAWLTAINASVAPWSTLILNVADLSRFCPSQSHQAAGQTVGFPLQFTLTGWIGVLAAGATGVVYGTSMWVIPSFFSVWSPVWAVFGGFVLAFCILICNVVANLLSPMNDLLNVAPRLLNFRWCGCACVAAAVAICPWWLFNSQAAFIYSFLNGYAMVTGGIAGVMITDFWVLRHRVLLLDELYLTAATGGPTVATGSTDTSCSTGGTTTPPPMTYRAGVNWRAVVALVAGVAPCFPGWLATLDDSIKIPVELTNLYSVSWFFAFGCSGVLYWMLTWASPPRGWMRSGVRMSYEGTEVFIDSKA